MAMVVAAVALMWTSCDTRAYIPDEDGKVPDVIPDRRQEEFLCLAVTYPKGYNWYRDSLSGNVPVSLELYLNDSLVRRIPVHASNGVCADGDRHFLCGSHILSHTRHHGMTLVSMDGAIVQEYESDEVIRSMLLHGGDTYTLSDDVQRMTWSLRVNGEVKAAGSRSVLCEGGLYNDAGEVCFAYNVMGRSGSYGEYHLVHGAADEIVFREDETKRLTALRQVGGQLNILATDSRGMLVWRSDELSRIMEIDPRDIGVAGFVKTGRSAVLHLILRSGSSWREMFLGHGAAKVDIPRGWQVYALAGNAPLLCYACCPDGMTSPVVVSTGERQIELEEHMMISPTAITVSAGGVGYVGVNRKNLRPEVIHGADTLSYDFNGYVTCISLP